MYTDLVYFSTIFCISLCILTLFFYLFFILFLSLPVPLIPLLFFLFWKPRSPLPSGCTHHMSVYSSDLYEQLHNSTSSHNHTHTHKHLSLFCPPHSLPSLSAPNPLTILMIQPSFFAISRGTASLPRICWTSTLPPIFTCLFLLRCPLCCPLKRVTPHCLFILFGMSSFSIFFCHSFVLVF